MADTEVPSGALQPQDTWGDYNQILFVVMQTLAKMQTATLVRIEACTNEGDDTAVGFVDVTPLVNQIDAAGNPTPHVTVYNVPYLRMQGGANAIIMDPAVGDIGICVFASRDISKVKSTKAQANPGSLRKYSFSDGLYLGGVLNGIPTQFVQFNADGITLKSPTAILLEAPTVTIEAPELIVNASTSVTITTPAFKVVGASRLEGEVVTTASLAVAATITASDMNASGDVTAGAISLKTHKHGGVQTGLGFTGPSVP